MQYYQLLDKLEKVYQRLEGQTLSAPEIVSRLNRAVSMPECKIVSIDTLSIISNDFNISGQYDPNLDRKGRRPIEVEIAFPKRRKYFTLEVGLRTRRTAGLPYRRKVRSMYGSGIFE